MMKHVARVSVALVVSSLVSLCVLASATAQIPVPGLSFGVGGDNPSSEDSRTPFMVRFKGFINSRPDPSSLAVVSMGIAKFNETYQFEVVEVRAVNLPKHIVTSRHILQQTGRYSIDYNLIGPSDLLSKISQAQPGTPLQIEGMFQQRRRRLTLMKVDVVEIVREGDPAAKADEPPS